VGNGTVGLGTAYSASPDIYTTNLESPASKANFYFVRQLTNTKTTDTVFTLRVNTTLEGEITVPKRGNLTLAGRESKVCFLFLGDLSGGRMGLMMPTDYRDELSVWGVEARIRYGRGVLNGIFCGCMAYSMN
jgi:hypothetical protein